MNGAGKKPLLPAPLRSDFGVLHTISALVTCFSAHLLTRNLWSFKVKETEPFQEAYHTIVFKNYRKANVRDDMVKII